MRSGRIPENLPANKTRRGSPRGSAYNRAFPFLFYEWLCSQPAKTYTV
nr:MAG TPA: hypothetical protein [Caudoviricetes sp.]